MEIIKGIVIKEVYPNFRAVLNSDNKFIGVVVKSRKYPSWEMFFAYDTASFYYGMSDIEAVQAYFVSKGNDYV